MMSLSSKLIHNLLQKCFSQTKPCFASNYKAAGFCYTLSHRKRFSALTYEMAAKLVLEKESRQYNWERAFDEIQSKERNSDRFSGLSVDVAGSLSNIELNRYHNVLAYDHSRALITDPDDKELYINAN